MSQPLTLLGSTGSIGTQVLDVVRHLPERFTVVALGAGKNLERLAQQAGEFHPQVIAIQSETDLAALRELLALHAPNFTGEILIGKDGLNALATLPETQVVIVGLVGLAGLEPTLKALESGKRVLTANKETFVTGGHLVQPYLDRVIPIDSEHAAIHQCLKGEPEKVRPDSVKRLLLTASGGPFRNFTREKMENVTLGQALKHPNWVMGSKITIDSATMMNKGLEVIEAHWLFGIPYEKIQVVVHPESIIHSGVEFVDGSILVQMGAPDMRGPIQYAMTYPERLPNAERAVHLDLLSLARLTIETPDLERFPCIRLAYEAGRMGSSATAVLNGADEMAVQLFLEEKISYCQLPQLLEAALKAHGKESHISAVPSLNDIHELDVWARRFVSEQAAKFSPTCPV
jgi:1-deoxy-D-xylulose-5-phosphate reductoisomerase